MLQEHSRLGSPKLPLLKAVLRGEGLCWLLCTLRNQNAGKSQVWSCASFFWEQLWEQKPPGDILVGLSNPSPPPQPSLEVECRDGVGGEAEERREGSRVNPSPGR